MILKERFTKLDSIDTPRHFAEMTVFLETPARGSITGQSSFELAGLCMHPPEVYQKSLPFYKASAANLTAPFMCFVK